MNPEKPHLEHVLGLGHTVGICIGTTIGAGVFAYTAIATQQTGPALPLAYGLAVIPVLFALAPIAMLGATIPTAGGNYKYPSRLLSPGLAFMGVWVFALGAFCGSFPLYALACVDYIGTYVPLLDSAREGSQTLRLLTAGGVLTVFFLINYFGVTLAATVEAILVGVLILALIVYAAVGIDDVNPQRFHDFMQTGWGGVIGGASLLTFAYMGSNAIIELGGEIKDPARTIPRALLIAVPIVWLVYMGVAIVTVGVLDWRVVAGMAENPPAPQPLTIVAKVFMHPALLMFFTIGGALVAIATTINATFIWGTKSLLVLCEDGLLPKSLGRIHARYHTPARLLTAIWLLSLLGLMLPLPAHTLAALATIGGLCIFIPVMVTAMILPRRCPEEYAASRFKLKGFWLYAAPTVGILLCLGAIGDLVTKSMGTLETVAIAVWFAIGLAYYLRLRKSRPEVRQLFGKNDF